jgi:hypothetical protein
MSGFLGVYRQDASFDERLLDGIPLNETSLSPGNHWRFQLRPSRRVQQDACGVCATLWEPGHSSIRTLEKFLRSATFPFWLVAMRPCVAMSSAAIVSRHPELDWGSAQSGTPQRLVRRACSIWHCNYPRVRWE